MIKLVICVVVVVVSGGGFSSKYAFVEDVLCVLMFDGR